MVPGRICGTCCRELDASWADHLFGTADMSKRCARYCVGQPGICTLRSTLSAVCNPPTAHQCCNRPQSAIRRAQNAT
eukprot:9278707-Alexandrium_andersonii.AAC.1